MHLTLPCVRMGPPSPRKRGEGVPLASLAALIRPSGTFSHKVGEGEDRQQAEQVINLARVSGEREGPVAQQREGEGPWFSWRRTEPPPEIRDCEFRPPHKGEAKKEKALRIMERRWRARLCLI